MPRLWVRVILFVSSYFPLTVIFALLNWQQHTVGAVGIAGFGLLSLIIAVVYFFLLPQQREATLITVQSAEPRDGDVLNYIAAYIVPFVTIPFGSWEEAASVLLLLVVLGVVYVNSNLISVNPMLNIAGYHLYQARFASDEESHLLLSKRKWMRTDPLRVVPIGNNIYLVRKARPRNQDAGRSTFDDE